MAPAAAAAADDSTTAQCSGWERAVAKFSGYFTGQGLGAEDIPAAIVLHEARGAGGKAGPRAGGPVRCVPRRACRRRTPISPRLPPSARR